MLSDDTTQGLLLLLRSEEEKTQKLTDTLRNVIQILENVQGNGGWEKLSETIVTAKCLLK